MTESARVEELEQKIKEMDRFANRQGANIRGRDETIAELRKDRDSLAALVERMRAEMENLIRRFEGPRIANMDRVATYAAEQSLKATPSASLENLRERCWVQAIEATMGHVHDGGSLMKDTEEITDSIVAELKRGGK